MITNLEKHFARIGADISIFEAPARQRVPVSINIASRRGREFFQVQIRKNSVFEIELSVIELQRADRHLLLLSRHLDRNGSLLAKDHFLCGFDERHLFVASVDGVSTVAQAKASLKPAEILRQEVGISTEKRNRRKNQIFKRQGEWFFVPADIEPDASKILRNEPLVRGNGSKAHIMQYAVRTGGEPVKVCRRYPNGVTIAEYKTLIAKDPSLENLPWRDMRRNPQVYASGSVRHLDHATLVLNGWYRVFMNREKRAEAVAFLD